jgi:hypothetical protein
MTQRTASCHCQRLQLECDGEPTKISMCHCLDCQRRTGSAFSVAVFFERSQVRIGGATSTIYERESASGFPVKFYFCDQCGSNVYWEPARLPELIGVAIGAFADPDFPCPEQSVWTKDKHCWFSLPESMAIFDVSPPPRR